MHKKNLTTSFVYKRREPQNTVMYKVVQNNYQNYFVKKFEMGIEYPKFIHDTFRKYLTCGILENGFVRCYCKTCQAEVLVSFSCKCRGVCPSCHGRRQAESAIHLDEIFPNYQYRQWVLSLPYEIRYTVANNSELTSKCLGVFTRSVERWYRKKARSMGYEETVTGSVLFIHRFNSALTLSPHFHSLFLDGVYYKKNDQYLFLSVGSPKKSDLEKIVERIYNRVKKILSKVESPENVINEFQNSIQNGVGHIKVLEHFMPVQKTEYKEDDDPYSAKLNGFSLNAKVVVQKDRRDKLKKLIGYVARGPIAQDRLTELSNGVCYKLKRTWSNGATHVIFSYESFIQRLVALIPPARSNQTRFFGIFAPNFKDRNKIIPTRKEDGNPPQKDSGKVLWADLIKMTFGIDVTVCNKCNGRMAPIAVIKDKKVARLILEAMKLTTKFEGLKTGVDPPTGQNHQSFTELSDQRPTDW
jgi:hypothetical protein